MRRALLIFTLISHCYFVQAQYFQFSQYNFTPQRINPASVGNPDYARVSFDYRNQSTAGGFHLTSNVVNASYPIIAKNGITWSGIGISLMDDRSGTAGIFNTQEVAISYAINVPVAFRQSISLGVKGLYVDRKIDLDGLYTGSQYIPDRGFNESISNGESLNQLRNLFSTFSAGLLWQQWDAKGNRIAHFGASFFDFNKPSDSFLGSESQLNSTVVSSMGFRAYQKNNVSMFPELLLTHSSGKTVLNAGFITRYDVRPVPNQVSAHIDIITKYVAGRSGILGLQIHRDNYSIGFSYDFPVIKRNVANLHTFEVGLELKKLVKPKKKTLTSRQRKPAPKSSPSRVAQKTPVKNLKDSTTVAKDSSEMVKMNSGDLSERLKQKQDSIKALATAGTLTHQALILEKATLHINFKFNSTEPDDKTTEYLNDLSKALNDNPELRIQLIGHTDNIGSDKFNLRLSYYRAEAIKAKLVEKGVPPDKILIDGKGKEEPITDNLTEESKAKNRRVELTIFYDH